MLALVEPQKYLIKYRRLYILPTLDATLKVIRKSFSKTFFQTLYLGCIYHQ